MNLDNESITEDLDQMVTTLDKNLSNLLEKHAPEKKKQSLSNQTDLGILSK